MSEPAVEQPEPKRRRRSGWDVQVPVVSSSEATSAPVVDQALVKQQAAEAYQAQQIAIQKAQQLIAQQAIQKSLGGIAANLPKPGCRIYVGSIHYDLREPDLVTLFSSFGQIVKSEMTLDPLTGRSKGFCFLEFSDPACAEAAQAMDGFELAGRKIKVGRPVHGTGAVAQPIQPASLIPGLGLAGLPVALPSLHSAVSAAPPVPTYVLNVDDNKLLCVLISNVAPSVGVKEVEDIFAGFGAIVMCKELPPVVASSFIATSSSGKGSSNIGVGSRRMVVEYKDEDAARATVQGMNGFDLTGQTISCEAVSRLRMLQLLSPSTMTHTFCTVLLERMVTVEDTKDPDLKEEIAEEARTYGNLTDVVLGIDEAKQEVEVKLLYADAASANKAHKAMNGRAFAGNKISAVLAP